MAINLERTASFDSELALVKEKTDELKMWQPNPFYLGFKGQSPGIHKSTVMMTSRLDAASPKIVKQIFDDSIGPVGEPYVQAQCKKEYP